MIQPQRFALGMRALERDAYARVSLFDSFSDGCGLMGVSVVLSHELTCLCASAHRLRRFSHMLPPFRWLY